MSMCLYHLEYGYYMRDRDRTGARGNCFTSSDLHPIFARLVARQTAEVVVAAEDYGVSRRGLIVKSWRHSSRIGLTRGEAMANQSRLR